jgi:hypothetical protein
MNGSVDPGSVLGSGVSADSVAFGVSSQDVAWVVVLIVCIVMMVAPFLFWGIVMVTRRKEQQMTERRVPVPEQAGLQDLEPAERAS